MEPQPQFEIVATYLSRKHFNYGMPVALATFCLCLLFSEFYWHPQMYLGNLWQVSPSLIFEQQQYWRLLTSALVHADLGHLFANGSMLLLMGYFVASYYGLWVFPVLMLGLSAVINFFVLLSFNHDITLVGASGIVYCLWGFWLILYVLIQRQVDLNRRIMKVTAISLFMLVPTSYEPNVSYLAHGIGFVLGICAGAIYFLFKRQWLFTFERREEIVPDPYDLVSPEEAELLELEELPEAQAIENNPSNNKLLH